MSERSVVRDVTKHSNHGLRVIQIVLEDFADRIFVAENSLCRLFREEHIIEIAKACRISCKKAEVKDLEEKAVTSIRRELMLRLIFSCPGKSHRSENSCSAFHFRAVSHQGVCQRREGQLVNASPTIGGSIGEYLVNPLVVGKKVVIVVPVVDIGKKENAQRQTKGQGNYS